MVVAWLLVVDHGDWSCSATFSAVWDYIDDDDPCGIDNVDDSACSGSRRGAQHGWALSVRFNIV
jgi:hypothetical protein